MNLAHQKRIAAEMLKCSEKRVWFDAEQLEDISRAITKSDIRGLIAIGAIKEKPIKGISKFRVRHNAAQRRKGRRSGHGSRKGAKGARSPRKRAWITQIRTLRKLLRHLREKELLTSATYQDLYLKSKGGFFRSKAHIKLYMKEHGLLK